MKHLRRFNEELSPWIYKSAAFKLKKMGHERRSKELDQYAETVSKKEEIIKWKKNIEEFSKYGKIKLKFKTDSFNKKEYEADFYFMLNFDSYMLLDSIGYSKENSRGYFEFPITFSVGLIPVDEENKSLFEKGVKEPDFYNGSFWGMWVNINYKVEDEKIQFVGISTNEYDEHLSGTSEFADRKSALTFKNALKLCFNETSDYPSSETTHVDMYDLLYKKLCQDLELLPEYNLSMEKIYNDINSFSVNKLYKE